MRKILPAILNSRDAALQLRHCISLETEELWVMALGPSHQLLKKQCVFRGTVDECIVHPREILRFGIMARASSLILAHSHPSGECFPSEPDLHFTQRIVSACELFQIPVLDHLIITRISHFSFADRLWN